MRKIQKNKSLPRITAEEFDRKAENGEDLFEYFDWENAKVTIIKRVNVDFPGWMINRLDQEAKKLNISRQAVIKMWINDRIRSNKKP